MVRHQNRTFFYCYLNSNLRHLEKNSIIAYESILKLKKSPFYHGKRNGNHL
jgi:hypothetical protein